MKSEELTFDRLPIAVTQLLETVNRIEKILTRPVEAPKPQRFSFIGAVGYLNELGYTISESKFSKLSAEGKLPSAKFNNRLVFEQSELDAWVKSQTVAVGDKSDVALSLAASANRKLRGGGAGDEYKK